MPLRVPPETATFIEDRMRAAGRLILAATNELADDPPFSRLDLSNLELVTMATAGTLRLFINEFLKHRTEYPPEACPHCGHLRSYERFERCPRCCMLRGVSRASALADPVRFRLR